MLIEQITEFELRGPGLLGRSFTPRDAQDHHLLVILKIKIRSSKKCDHENQDQNIKIM